MQLVLEEKTESECFFLVDGSYTKKIWQGISEKNILEKKSLPGRLGWKIWYDWQVPAIVKKYKPNVLITTGGIASSCSAMPQCVWMPDKLNKNDAVKNKKYFRFYQKRLQKTLHEAKIFFTVSEKNKKSLLQQFSLANKKVIILYSAANENYHPLSWTERENVKVRYAGGKEYFVMTQSCDKQNDLLNLLKAFSQFKKRQQSNMQLVLTGIDTVTTGGFAEKLETFKYRKDIHFYNNLQKDELIKIIAASYAFVHPFDEGPRTAILNAFKTGIPVITTAESSMPEITGDAVLYADLADPELFANQLMLLYKDESLRNILIEKGKIQVQQFSWQKSVMQLWDGIMSAIKN